jgi:uncharacterized membrane protein
MVKISIKSGDLPQRERRDRKLRWFVRLNLLALGITAYLSYLHFKPSASTVCTINAYLDCDIVNKSIYAELWGIPVAILGFLTYLFLLLVAQKLLKGFAFTALHPALTFNRVSYLLWGVTAFGFLFSSYLTYVEIFILRAACIFCLAQYLILIINLFILSSLVKTLPQENS